MAKDKMARNGSPGQMADGPTEHAKDPEEKKPFIITRVFNKITSSMEDGFYKLGLLIGCHPLKCVLLSVFVVGIFSLGVLNLTQNTDADTLWVPSDTPVFEHKLWVSANFPTTIRMVSVILVSNNILSTSSIQAMNSLYKGSASLSTSSGKVYTDVCFMSGSNCLVNSVLELWSYDDTTITAASTADILTKINTATVSPMYGRPYAVSTSLGSITYSGNQVSAARAAKMTFFLKGDDGSKADSMAWESKMVDLVLNTQSSGVSDYFVLATRSFSDVAGDTIRGDITFLSAGYMIVILYVIIILGRFNCVDMGFGIAICGIMVIGISIGFSYGLASAAGWEYTPLHSVLPFLLLGIGVDDLFVIMGAYKSLPLTYRERPIHERIAMTMKHAGVSITVTSLTDICAFGIGATTVLPALKSFCIFCCLGILALFLLAVTFFVGCITLNAKRRQAGRNACICCYKHDASYKPNECSETEVFVRVMKKFYAPNLMRLPVKIGAMVVTAIFLGFGIWGFVSLKQNYNPIWFLPTDSYPYKYDNANNAHFNTGIQAAVYCKNIDYYSSKTQFNSLYAQLTSSSYIATGSTDSWFRSFTDWLSTTSTASVTARLDGNKYPSSSTNFYDLLYEFATTVPTGLRHRSELIFSNNSGTLGVSASSIRYTHVVLSDTTSKVNAMDNAMGITSGLFPNDQCFPYGRFYLQWYTNKVIQQELYRNLGLAVVCVFVVCLVLIANLFTSLMVLSCVVFTLLDVGGMMHFWGLTIDTVTSIILILSIGLAIDYSAHIGHCFMTFVGNRNARVRNTLVEMGSPVFSGAFSTFLAFILLGFSNSYVFTTFFKVFLLVVIFGVFHGLVYLPVLLSWIGPSSYMSATREDSGAGDIELTTTTNSHKGKSQASLQGAVNPGFDNKFDRPTSQPQPPDVHVANEVYNQSPNQRVGDQSMHPPPDHSPLAAPRPTNMPTPATYFYGREHISHIPNPQRHFYHDGQQRLYRHLYYQPENTYSDWYYNNDPYHDDYYNQYYYNQYYYYPRR